jgi:disulfide bond formation protein DsbB
MASAELTSQLESTDEDESEVTHLSKRGVAARIAMYVALAAAWIATCGSLFMSEALGWIPCQWCWYQRIFMYPLALVLATGLINRDRNAPKYALVLAVPGILASSYHIGLQKIPALAKLETCTTTAPCSADYLNWLGFITIPMLAWVAFAIIIVSSVIALRARNERENYLNEGPMLGLSPVTSTLLIAGAIAAMFLLSGIMTRNQRPAATLANTVQAAAASGLAASRDSAVLLYNESCAGCHGPSTGALQNIRADWLKAHSDLEVMATIRAGRAANALDNFSGQAMPANGGRISIPDDQLLALVRYLREVKGS